MTDLPGRGTRLLYIDDDPALARLVEKDLSRRGYSVAWAGDGGQGLARLASGGFDVVALDHFLPGQEGLEVLGEIRQLTAAPPVIYVTGAEESRIAVAALKAGAADYVIKDVASDFTTMLAAAIEEALEKERLRRAKEAAEAQVRAARDRAEALLREMNHRVGNSLQLVSGFVALQAGLLEDVAARDALRETQSRIEAVAQVHRSLYTSDQVETVELADYLGRLTDQLRQSLASRGPAPELELTAASLTARTDAAVSLGVILAELVTNAAKYAYPDGSGPVRIRLSSPEPGRGQLVVEDDGVGLGGPIQGTGLGRTIIEAMASSLKSAVEYDSPGRGLRAAVAFDLA